MIEKSVRGVRYEKSKIAYNPKSRHFFISKNIEELFCFSYRMKHCKEKTFSFETNIMLYHMYMGQNLKCS